MGQSRSRAVDPDDIVDLDLDTYRHEEPTKPFRTRVRGRVLTFKDPALVPYDVFLTMDSSDFYGFLAVTLDGDPQDPDSDIGHFTGVQKTDKPLLTRDLRLLMNRFRAHYGMGDPGKDGVSRP